MYNATRPRSAFRAFELFIALAILALAIFSFGSVFHLFALTGLLSTIVLVSGLIAAAVGLYYYRHGGGITAADNPRDYHDPQGHLYINEEGDDPRVNRSSR